MVVKTDPHILGAILSIFKSKSKINAWGGLEKSVKLTLV